MKVVTLISINETLMSKWCPRSPLSTGKETRATKKGRSKQNRHNERKKTDKCIKMKEGW
jgi:hypothetical protein